MSIDMSQFYGVFIEESDEHLNDMERLLMAIDLEAPDHEDLNAIFRAAHSIKGGSGIFGFDALTSLTHVMENLFDAARQGKYQLSAQVVDELLQAVDVLRLILNAYRDSEQPDWAMVEAATERVEALLAPPASVDDSFGFFDEALNKEVPNHEEADDSFGIFSPVVTGDDKPAYGFFEPMPAPTAEPLADPASNEHQDDAVNHAAEANTAPRVPVVEPPKKPSTPAAKKTESVEANSIRVDIQKIDHLVNLAGELVITQSMLNLIGADVEGPTAERLQMGLAELERNTRELQESIMSIRMLPLSFVFNRFPRVVRDLSTKLNKQVELVVEGGHTEIDKGLIERLVDPLTHLVRNSLDHGIESPETRRTAGKPEVGTLLLKAEQKGGNILICVQDDGGGLNREKILAKAQERGIDIGVEPTDNEVWQLIMAPGFSTAAAVTDVSGRGVGMDVVKRNIESMGGRVEIQSAPKQGTTIEIRLPLTLAILDGMTVAVANQQFIIPLVNIIESVQPVAAQLKQISGQHVLELRDVYWPIVRLHEFMAIEGAQTQAEHAILVLVESSKTRFALQVDDLIGQQQAVIKSLEQHYRRVPGVAGATIMGDGCVALILDVESMASQIQQIQRVQEAV